jgi:hypothetical protein
MGLKKVAFPAQSTTSRPPGVLLFQDAEVFLDTLGCCEDVFHTCGETFSFGTLLTAGRRRSAPESDRTLPVHGGVDL